MQNFVTNLKSKNEHVRLKSAQELSLYVKSELREAAQDEITNFVEEFNHQIFEMLTSNDVNEKKGGILAIGRFLSLFTIFVFLVLFYGFSVLYWSRYGRHGYKNR